MPKGNHSTLKNTSGLGSKVGQLLCWMFDAPIDLLIACSNSIKIFEHLTKTLMFNYFIETRMAIWQLSVTIVLLVW